MCVALEHFAVIHVFLSASLTFPILSMVRQIFTTRLGKSSIEKLMLNVYKYKAFYFFLSHWIYAIWCVCRCKLFFFSPPVYVPFAPFFFLFWSLVIRISIPFDVLFVHSHTFSYTHIHLNKSHLLEWISYFYMYDCLVVVGTA